MSDMIGGVYLVVLLIGGLIWLSRKARAADDDPDPADDFALLTVREQIAEAKATSDALDQAEQLITDMAECSEDDVLVVRLEWIGHDAEKHLLELYCDGINTAAECLSEIGEREAHDLQAILSRQCAILADGGRHRQNCLQSSGFLRGEDANDEVMSAVRRGYFGG